MNHVKFVFITFLLISCSQHIEITDNIPENGNWVDLTYEFSDKTVYWPTGEHFRLEEEFLGMTKKGYFYSSNSFSAAEHGGTHIDAPIHFYKGRNSVEQIPLERLIGEAVVIDVSESALKNTDYEISIEDLKKWENDHGTIPKDAILLLRTGYGKFWPDKNRYMGTDETGPEAVKKLHFPALDPEAAAWLTDNREISAVGIDTPSIDFGQSTHFESHQILFRENIPVFENVANLDKLPVKGAMVIALPMKIKGGTGAPLRIIANIPAR